jgi:hypothetical protein
VDVDVDVDVGVDVGVVRITSTQYSTVLKTDAVQYSYKCSVSKIGEVFRADSAR